MSAAGIDTLSGPLNQIIKDGMGTNTVTYNVWWDPAGGAHLHGGSPVWTNSWGAHVGAGAFLNVGVTVNHELTLRVVVSPTSQPGVAVVKIIWTLSGYKGDDNVKRSGEVVLGYVEQENPDEINPPETPEAPEPSPSDDEPPVVEFRLGHVGGGASGSNPSTGMMVTYHENWFLNDQGGMTLELTPAYIYYTFTEAGGPGEEFEV